MILRRFFTLAALTVAASLNLGGRAYANYDISTSFASATGGVTVVTANATGNFTDNRLSPPPGNPDAPFGYTELTTTGGSTIWIINDFRSNQLPGVNSPYTVTVDLSSPGPDTATFSVTLNIAIADPPGSAASTPPNVFTETANYTLNVQNNGTGGLAGGLSAPTPTVAGTVTVNGHTFTISNPGDTPATPNSTTFDGGIGATISTPSPIPEPASVVMLGAGLVGVIALGVRRRSKLA